MRALLPLLVLVAACGLATPIPILPSAAPEAPPTDAQAMEAAAREAGMRFQEDIDRRFDVPEAAMRDVDFAARELRDAGKHAPRFAEVDPAPEKEAEKPAAGEEEKESTPEEEKESTPEEEKKDEPAPEKEAEPAPEKEAAPEEEEKKDEPAPEKESTPEEEKKDGEAAPQKEEAAPTPEKESTPEEEKKDDVKRTTEVTSTSADDNSASNMCWRWRKPRASSSKEHDKREGLAAWTAADGTIYVYGGVGGGINHPHGAAKQVLAYDPAKDAWLTKEIVVEDATELASTGAAFAYDGAKQRLYEFGGMRASASSAAFTVTRTLAYVDMSDGNFHWTKVKPANAEGSSGLPAPVRQSAIAVHGGNTVVAFGGITDVARTNNVFYTVPGTWAWHKPALNGKSPAARTGHVLVSAGDSLFLYGGYDGKTVLGDLQRLTPPKSGALEAEAWEWTELTPLNPAAGLQPAARAFVTPLLLPGSKLLLHSGSNAAAGQVYHDAAVLDLSNPDAPAFAALPESLAKSVEPQAHSHGAAALVKGGDSVLYFGGKGKGTFYDVFQPQELDMAGVCRETCKHGQYKELAGGEAECECEAAYGGKLCDAQSTCPENCGGERRGKCVGGKCECRAGFTGASCMTMGCPNDCNKAGGNGVCMSDRCLCHSHFFGLDCANQKCEHNCHGRGYCNPVPGQPGKSQCECKVPHFSGASCEVYGAHRAPAPKPSSFLELAEEPAAENKTDEKAPEQQAGDDKKNGTDAEAEPVAAKDEGAAEKNDTAAAGSSSSSNSTGGGDAAAADKKNGTDPVQTTTQPEPTNRGGETVPGPAYEYRTDYSCPDNCGGQGLCRRTVDEDGNVRGVCECREGFTGADCSGECALHCSGKLQGKCVGDAALPRCECAVGFRGAGCEETFCARNCSDHGDCKDGKCMCKPPWTGAGCHLDGACNEHGTFKDGAYCECEEGWGGFRCEEEVKCAHDCGDNGVCVGRVVLEADKDKPIVGECRCSSDYRGEACEKRRCPSDCSGQGSCSEDGKCSCFGGFAGVDCSHVVTCPNNCTGDHGVCRLDQSVEPKSNSSSTGVCECEPRWSGEACNDLGCPHQCNKRGDCIEGKCRCDAGYSGAECEVACPRKCQAEDGTPRGICVKSACLCFPGYNGTDCSIRAKCPGHDGKLGECSGNGECFQGSAKCFCKPGFAGDDCSVESQCGPTQCSGKGKCTHGKCFCNPGFEGEHCERKASCEDDCNGRGLCANGECFCNTGFSGATCGTTVQDPTCTKNCSGNGVCQFGRCFCVEGYDGDHCQTPTSDAKCRRSEGATELCEGRGLCRFGQCFCSPGFAGEHCEAEEVCEGGCVKDQGVCLLGECRCLPGFKGPDCSEDDVCEGTPLPCTGHGVCIQGGCACLPGYAGAACEKVVVKPESKCENNCTDGGVCHLGRCFCIEGRDGKDCSLKTQDACPEDCSRKGLCRFGQCFCKPGYAGRACEQKLECSDKCMRNGVCAYGHCFCVPGYTGKDCDRTVDEEERTRLLEQDISDAVKLSQSLAPQNSSTYCYGGCGGQGTCINNRCFCAPGFYGSNCQSVDGGPLTHRCASNCSGNGQCLFGKCFCDGGYTGPACNDTVVLGCRYNCNGKGTCHAGQCFCDPGFEGSACERASTCPEECDKGGHGLCRSGVCECVAGYYGPTCNKTNVLQPRFTTRARVAGASTASVLTLDNCPTRCAENGVCVNSQCYCKSGWTGADCASPEAAAPVSSLRASVAGGLGAEESASLLGAAVGGGQQSAVSYGLLSVLSFAAGIIVCVIGQIAWAKHKEMSRKRATKDIFKPLLHTLE